MIRLKDWTVDSIYAVNGFSQMYIYRKPPKHYLEFTNEGKYPVLVIQGYLNKWGFMKGIADEISLHGHPVYVFPQLGNNLKNIAGSAEIVYELIEKENLKNVIIVGHSKGGLIGKYILAFLDKKENVKGVIAIGTPFHGSNAAKPFKILKSNEFDPDNDSIKNLALHQDVNHKIITISASYDNIVRHEKKGSLEGALENIEVKAAGHHKIIYDKEVRQKILSSIEKLSS